MSYELLLKKFNFFPSSNDWSDVWKGLAAWSNESDVIIRFRCISDNGNNLFLDDIQVVDAVGIKENTKISSRVFPNPAENSANVELQGVKGKNIKIELYNLLGEIIYTRNYKPTSNFDCYNIDLSYINNGIYNLVLKDGVPISTKKLQIAK